MNSGSEKTSCVNYLHHSNNGPGPKVSAKIYSSLLVSQKHLQENSNKVREYKLKDRTLLSM